jgi:fimbrial isopeptide formation D2 family protein
VDADAGSGGKTKTINFEIAAPENCGSTPPAAIEVTEEVATPAECDVDAVIQVSPVSEAVSWKLEGESVQPSETGLISDVAPGKHVLVATAQGENTLVDADAGSGGKTKTINFEIAAPENCGSTPPAAIEVTEEVSSPAQCEVGAVITVSPVDEVVSWSLDGKSVQPSADGKISGVLPGGHSLVASVGGENTLEGADEGSNGKTKTFQVSVTPPRNCGVTPPTPVNPPTDVVNPSTLGFVKDVNKSEAKVGEKLHYSMTATVEEGPNNGVARQDNVKIVDQLPQGITFVKDTGVCSTMTKVDPPRKVTCTVTYNNGKRTIQAVADDYLQVGDSLELEFDATVDKGATMIDNWGVASSDDVADVKDDATTSVTAVEGVIIEKPPVQQPGTVAPGTEAPGTVAQPATLPHTGADGSRLPLAGLVLIGLGLAMVVGSRRRAAGEA